MPFNENECDIFEEQKEAQTSGSEQVKDRAV